MIAWEVGTCTHYHRCVANCYERDTSVYFTQTDSEHELRVQVLDLIMPPNRYELDGKPDVTSYIQHVKRLGRVCDKSFRIMADVECVTAAEKRE